MARVHGVQATDIERRTEAGKAANTWLFDAERGPWADASARFADATRGEVKVIASGAASDRVFALTELPHILTNPELTTIESRTWVRVDFSKSTFRKITLIPVSIFKKKSCHS